MHIHKIQLLLLLFFLTLFSASGDIVTGTIPDQPITDKNSSTDIFDRSHFIGEEVNLLLPALNRSDTYFTAVGGSFTYENYLLSGLLSPNKTLPGLMMGLTGTMYIFNPLTTYFGEFGKSTIFTIGAYIGFQLYFPVHEIIAFSPAFYGGIKSYHSLHFFKENLHYSDGPLAITGLNLNFILLNKISLGLKGEYEFFLERIPTHTMNFSLRIGTYL